MRRPALAALGLVIVVVIGVILLSPGGTTHHLRIAMIDAEGLRNGEAVVVGGVPVGKVSNLKLVQPGDQVIAELTIKNSAWPVGRDASAAINSVNLLGQKELDLIVGNRADPAPDGYLIGASRVTPSTDLDQVLDVLDPLTRARLSVFLDEAGLALTGRRMDLSNLLQELPSGLADTTQLLNSLVSDNHTLADLLQSSGQFIDQINQQRAGVTRMVHVVGQAAAVVASRRSELLQTLAQTPPALGTLRTFLAQLQTATVPIRPAAIALSSAARPLTETLAQLEPFRQAAQPALATATRVAPDLSRLALGATPVLQQARRPLDALASFSTDPLPKIGNVLNGSVDNAVAVAADWGHAIQLRDGLSHIFRGEVSFTAEALRSAVSRLMAMQGTSTGKRRPAAQKPTVITARPPTVRPTTRPAPAPGTAPQSSIQVGPVTIPNPVTAVQQLVAPVVNQLTGSQSTGGSSGGVSGVLKYLLGP
jgi:phospholipid/cholesterol/gamma-HCH transport system substrate-binding protein